MKEEDRKALIEHRISKADDAVRDVEFLIKSNRPLLAINRIYYGIFYILSALSLKHDFHTSKHQQLAPKRLTDVIQKGVEQQELE
jgi:uncharacterized protein (UPF0332 family)